MAKSTAHAIQLCDDALDALKEAERTLAGARTWGIFDLLGGGVLSTFVKHDRISDANISLQKAQYALQGLSEELQHLNLSSLNVDVSFFLTLFDYWSDDLISEFLVQSKIKKAIAAVKQSIGQVTALRNMLESSL